MDRNTDVDEVFALQDESKPSSLGASFAGPLDIAIALAPRARDITLVGATRAKVRVGYTYVRRYAARLTAPLYLTKLGISDADPQSCERDPQRVVLHEVDQLLDLVALAGATQRTNRLRIDITAQDRAAVDFLPQGPLVFHLGLRWFCSGNTLQNTIALIGELRQFGIPIVVTHSSECEEQARAIEAARVAHTVLGGLTFHRWAAAFERARCVVTVDTGATHVASAMRRPTVVVFEHRYFRLSSQEWAPYGVPYGLVRKPADQGERSLAQLRRDVLGALTSLIDA